MALVVRREDGRLRRQPAQVLNEHYGQVGCLLLHLGELSPIHVATGKRDAQNAGERRCFTLWLVLRWRDTPQQQAS